MINLIGCSKENFFKLLKLMNYTTKKTKDKKAGVTSGYIAEEKGETAMFSGDTLFIGNVVQNSVFRSHTDGLATVLCIDALHRKSTGASDVQIFLGCHQHPVGLPQLFNHFLSLTVPIAPSMIFHGRQLCAISVSFDPINPPFRVPLPLCLIPHNNSDPTAKSKPESSRFSMEPVFRT